MPRASANKFLNIIKQIESSGGTDFSHETMQHGIHAGQSAIGNYGLLPDTVQELVHRRALSHTLTPKLKSLQNMEPNELKDYLENPKASPIEDKLAGDLANHVLNKSNDDMEKAAYMWNMGHNLDPNTITEDDLNQSPYVQKFRRVNDILQTQELNKQAQDAQQRSLDRSSQYRQSPIPVDNDEDDQTSTENE